MIGSLGVPELLFILVLALLVFGPRKLPEIGRTLGRALGEFRRATTDLKRTLDVELSTEEPVSPKPPKAPKPPTVPPEPVTPENPTPPPTVPVAAEAEAGRESSDRDNEA
jgi:TatA/E family protein of Tat protein translocase